MFKRSFVWLPTEVACLIVSGVFLYLFASCSGKKTAIFYGDSITVGVGASNPGKRWTTLLCKEMGLRERNIGVSSSTLINGTDTFNRAKSMDELSEYEPVKKSAADYIFIAYGTNDIGFNTRHYTPELFENRMDAIIKRFLFRGFKPEQLIVVSPYYTNQTGRNRYTQIAEIEEAATEQRLARFFDISKQLAEKYECRFVDVYHPMKERSGLLYDGTHPNDEGYSFLAMIIADQL